MIYLKVLNENNCKSRIMYPAKVSYKMKGIKPFSDTNRGSLSPLDLPSKKSLKEFFKWN